MRYKQIIESKAPTAESVAKQILKDCKPYLSEIGYDVDRYSLYRGLGDIERTFFKGLSPVNRPPRDTNRVLHQIVDEWFLEKTGIRFRSNAVFAVGDPSVANDYGIVYSIFPIGKFKFVWSKAIKDLTYSVLEYIDPYEYMPQYSNDEENTKARNDLPNNEELRRDIAKLLLAGKYSSTDLRGAIDSGHEISIHCPDGYYLLIDVVKDSKLYPWHNKILDIVNAKGAITTKPAAKKSPAQDQKSVENYVADIKWANDQLAIDPTNTVASGVLKTAKFNLQKHGINV